MQNFVLINTNKVKDQLINIFNNYGPRFLRATFFLILGIIFIRLFSKLLDRTINFIRLSYGLREILLIIIKSILWVLLTVGVFQILGLSNIAITAGALAAVVSFGLSQGLTPTVRDLLAGLQLSSDHDFKIGDEVEVGQKELRVRGFIIEMDTKKIRIIDKNKKLHVLPNSLVDANEWTLLGRDDVQLEHLSRSDIIRVIHHRIKKGTKK